MISIKIKNWLSNTNSFWFSLYAIAASFSVYACMYAFRKPYTVGTFDGYMVGALDYKTILVITQVIGYTLSKFIGIKVVSEMNAAKRAVTILILIGISEVALFLFAVTPTPYNFLLIFFNGLPLGMVWGLVFSFLEGRRLTELLGAGLSVSFIVSSGFVKSIGAYIMQTWNVSEFQMPFITGAVFILPLLFFTWLLNLLPPPTKEDEELRTVRVPMNGKERAEFFKMFASGIVILTFIYIFLTAYRDVRDNYAADIWKTLGYIDQPEIFTITEFPVAVVVLVIMASLMYIKDNMKALIANHYIILAGILLVGASTFAFESGLISPVWWMIFVGLGLYMGYVPFNCILFDRFIATYKTAANAGFLIYISDSFGYLGSVGLQLFKNFGQADISWYHFFIETGYILTIFGGALTVFSIFYFRKKQKQIVLETANAAA